MRRRQMSTVVIAIVSAAVVIGLWFAAVWMDRQAVVPEAERERLNQEFEAKKAAREKAEAKAEKAAVTLTVKRPKGRPLRVLFAGDSLTVGWGATTEEQSFRAQITRELEVGGPVETTVAKGVSGDLYRAYNLGEFGTAQDLAIVEIGTNDLPRIKPGEFRREYSAMLDRITATSPDVRFLCVGVWHAYVGGTSPFPFESEFNDVIYSECQEKRGGKFVDVKYLISDENIGPEGKPTWTGESDDFHPNNAGHKALAEAIGYQLEVR